MDNANPLIASVLNDCVTALICPVGEFYPNKDYGSRIKRNIAYIDEERLLCYARQALSLMNGVFVKSAEKDNFNVIFTVIINDEEERQVSISFE